MANMGEVSSSRFNARRHLQGLIDTEMGRMWLVSQGVDDERFHASDRLRNLERYLAAITQIGDQFPPLPGKKVTVHGRVSMRNRQRRDLSFAQEKWPRHDVRFWFEISGKRIERFESKFKDSFEVLHRFGCSINRHEAALI